MFLHDVEKWQCTISELVNNFVDYYIAGMKPPKRRSPIPTLGAGLLVLFGCRGDRTTAGLDRDPSDPQALELSPIGGVVTGGDTIRFAAQVVRRDGSRAPAVRPGFEATGGQIDSSGLYLKDTSNIRKAAGFRS